MECVMMAAAAAATTTASGTTSSSSDHDSSTSVGSAVGSEANARFAVLSYEQVKRLDLVMDLDVPIHGRGNFPTLDVKLKQLVQVVRTKLEAESVRVKDIRLNGGAASYVLADSTQPYNDIDLIFGVDLSGGSRDYDRVKNAVLDSLLDFLPSGVNKKRISSCSLKEGYVHKMVKVQGQSPAGAKSGVGGDRWSLISLSNSSVHGGRNVELKFVDTMRRQFEFSVDSFQVILDSLLLFYDCAEMPMGESFYPTVVGESVYGHFQESLSHLRRKLIATRNPEEIRGGGLLKYCNLLVRDYRPIYADQIKSLERYMCSRFFIDFSDLGQQQQKLENYLTNHFAGEEHLMYQYLVTLHRVVDESTVCLMGHERRQTLGLIEELACQIYFREQQQRFYAAAAVASTGKQSTTPPPPPQTGLPQFDFPHLFYHHPHHQHHHHQQQQHHQSHHHNHHHHQPQPHNGAFYYAGHYIPQHPQQQQQQHLSSSAAVVATSSSAASVTGGNQQQFSCAPPTVSYSWMPCA